MPALSAHNKHEKGLSNLGTSKIHHKKSLIPYSGVFPSGNFLVSCGLTSICDNSPIFPPPHYMVTFPYFAIKFWEGFGTVNLPVLI